MPHLGYWFAGALMPTVLAFLSTSAGDLTFHEMAHLRSASTDPGQGMVTLAAEAQPAVAVVAAAVAAAATPAAVAPAAAMPEAGGQQLRGTLLAGDAAAEQRMQPQQRLLPLAQSQPRQRQQQQQPSAKDVFRLATHVFRSNVLGRK